MTTEDILKHNQKVKEDFNRINEEYQVKFEALPETIAPCATCKYDGVYRCETCEENFFEGYNRPDYPEDRYAN